LAVEILNIPLEFREVGEVFETICRWRSAAKRAYLVYTNPHSIVMCHRDADMMSATMGAELVLADGVGIVIAARLLGRRPACGRVPGPEFMLQLLDIGRTQGLRHFLYGAAPHVLSRLRERLIARFPELIICGAYSPPFHEVDAEEDSRIIHLMSDAKPDVVWVGLGAPKQEKWIAAHLGRIDATVMIGVGAAFDFHAGAVPWAPKWIRAAGLEWAYRLLWEPRRLWRRNVDSFVFLALVLAQRFGFLTPRADKPEHKVTIRSL